MGEEEGVATRGDRGGAASVGGEPWLEPAWRRLQANAKSFVPECSLTRQMPSPLPSYLARHRSAHASGNEEVFLASSAQRRRRSAPRSRHAHEFTRVHEHAQDDTRACTRELAGRRSERPRLSIGLLVTLRGGRGPLDPLTAAAAHGERGPTAELSGSGAGASICTGAHGRARRAQTSDYEEELDEPLLASADYRFAYRSLRSAARRSAISGGGNVSRAS
ncbi:unnamed protein product [Lampetra planeri]